MSFRVLPPFIQFLKNDGSLNSGGTVTTYLTDLTTLAPTYSEPGLTTSNGSTVDLDAYGRPEVDMWSAVLMGVVVKDSLGVTVSTLNNVPGYGGEDQELPTDGDPDDFLQWDGAGYILAPVRQVPDPTGLVGYYLGSDGTSQSVWIQFPETPDPPTPEYDINLPADIQIGDYLEQFGTGTVAAAPSAQTNNVVIVFAKAFDSTPVKFTLTNTTPGGSTGSGRVASLAYTGLSTTQVTVTANVGEDDTQSQYKLTNATTFSYTVGGEYTP